MQGMMSDDLREELAAIDRFLTQMETGRRHHPTKLVATRLLRIEKKLPCPFRSESLIAKATAMVFEGELDPLTELTILRMAWASAVRLLARTYGLQLIHPLAQSDSRAA
ncbi:MAG TPA: hypothetical protein VD978_20175 [Azospirillum sp.]|nr:hypothetical protein [Azospirillum sp.]